MRGAKDEEEPKFMQRTCDICGDRVATLFESVVIDNNPVEYGYCQECYENALKCGKSPHEEADYRLSRRTKECKRCGYTVEDFEKHFLFGCADCYSQMRKIALDAASKAQGISAELLHAHAPQNTVRSILELKSKDGERTQSVSQGILKSAKDFCSYSEFIFHVSFQKFSFV